MNIHHGHILTSHWEDLSGHHQLRYLGVDAHGPFELIFTDQRPLFFVERDAVVPSGNYRYERKSVPLKSFMGRDVDALYFNSQKELYEAKDDLAGRGVRTYESDVRPEERFLMERFINASVEWVGEAQTRVGHVRQFLDPQVKAGNFRPQHFGILSFDIETSRGNDLYSIGMHFKKGEREWKKVYMVGPARKGKELDLFETEQEVYQAFEDAVDDLDPDIIIGWHVIGFDLAFLERKCQRWGRELRLGRKRTRVKITERKGVGWFASLEGRVVIDGPPALRAAFYSFEDFKLETVARELLGAGKDIGDSGLAKVEEIERRFREDKESLAKYNLLDCSLVHEVYEKTGLIDLITTRTRISGLLMDRIGVSTAAFDHFMLPQIHRKGLVGPNIVDIQREGHQAGGHVLEPITGLHEHVIVLDFKSLYPSIIKTFFIDPYSRLKGDINPVDTPAGIRFSRTEHILPRFIDELLEQRRLAREKGDAHLSQAIKILMNSFYGVMGSAGSRFYHADLPRAITGTGRWILQKAVSFFEDRGMQVIYGDTDSVFVKLNQKDFGRPFEKGDQLARQLNQYMLDLLRSRFDVESHLIIEFEQYFRKFFLPHARNSEGGAKKRYAGLSIDRSKHEELVFAGLEVVRSDWTKVAKNFQYQLFQKLFYGEELEDFIRTYVAEIKDGKYDHQLIYKKRLTKDISEYTKSLPPHVRAARMLQENGHSVGRSIRYIMTRRGPVPIELDHHDIDYEHYIERQIRPLADSVLGEFKKSFDSIVVGDQLSLF